MQVIKSVKIHYDDNVDPKKITRFTVVAYGDDHNLFIDRLWGRSPSRIDVDTLKRDRVPLEHVYPSFDAASLSLAPHPLPDNTYVKLPDLCRYMGYEGQDERNDNISKLTLQEANVCQLLSRSPHGNVAEYLGCQVRSNRIVALCFRKYRRTLNDVIERDRVKVNKHQVLDDIRRGIEHIHSLGYCHNDINPCNVMFDDDGTVVIIDFDSCRACGEKLGLKKGTQGYFRKGETMSQQSNDFFGLARIEEFIDEHSVEEELGSDHSIDAQSAKSSS